MIRASRFSIIAAAMFVIAGGSALPAQTPAPAPAATAPTIRAMTDRTAMWIGDRLTYTVEIVCPRGVDVLEDDLSKEKLQLDGLEVVGADNTRTEGAGEVTTRRFNYVLTSYRPEIRSRKIGSLASGTTTRPGQRLEDTPPAGSVQVPATVVAFRSMLPEDVDTPGIRDVRPLRAARADVHAGPAGRPRPRLGRRSRRRSSGGLRCWREPGCGSLSGQRGRSARRSAPRSKPFAMSIESESGRREAFDQIDRLVRAHLHDVTADRAAKSDSGGGCSSTVTALIASRSCECRRRPGACDEGTLRAA